MPDYMKLGADPLWRAYAARQQHRRRHHRALADLLEGIATGYLAPSHLGNVPSGYACWAVN